MVQSILDWRTGCWCSTQAVWTCPARGKGSPVYIDRNGAASPYPTYVPLAGRAVECGGAPHSIPYSYFDMLGFAHLAAHLITPLAKSHPEQSSNREGGIEPSSFPHLTQRAVIVPSLSRWPTHLWCFGSGSFIIAKRFLYVLITVLSTFRYPVCLPDQSARQSSALR